MTDSDLTPRRRRLPDVSLPPLSGGAAIPLRAHRRAAVLVLLDDTAGEREGEYLRRLADAEAALREWDGRVLVIVAGKGVGVRRMAEALRVPFPVVADPDGRVAAAAGLTAPALVVADQWGEAHVAEPVGPDQPWLAPAEIEKWLRFLAVRCAG